MYGLHSLYNDQPHQALDKFVPTAAVYTRYMVVICDNNSVNQLASV
jgi:hypothetical protein